MLRKSKIMAHSEGFQKLAAIAKTRIKEISVDKLSELDRSQNPVIIDVREESEWNAGHAEGAIHLSLTSVQKINKRTKNRRSGHL
jgi:rhodanese-related sulfurtransferase